MRWRIRRIVIGCAAQQLDDHTNETMTDLAALDLRSYIAEPDRGRRDWSRAPAAKGPVYRNRHRIRGVRGKRLQRRRGELISGDNGRVAAVTTVALPGGAT